MAVSCTKLLAASPTPMPHVVGAAIDLGQHEPLVDGEREIAGMALKGRPERAQRPAVSPSPAGPRPAWPRPGPRALRSDALLAQARALRRPGVAGRGTSVPLPARYVCRAMAPLARPARRAAPRPHPRGRYRARPAAARGVRHCRGRERRAMPSERLLHPRRDEQRGQQRVCFHHVGGQRRGGSRRLERGLELAALGMRSRKVHLEHRRSRGQGRAQREEGIARLGMATPPCELLRSAERGFGIGGRDGCHVAYFAAAACALSSSFHQPPPEQRGRVGVAIGRGLRLVEACIAQLALRVEQRELAYSAGVMAGRCDLLEVPRLRGCLGTLLELAGIGLERAKRVGDILSPLRTASL